jgi:hypothetical protein
MDLCILILSYDLGKEQNCHEYHSSATLSASFFNQQSGDEIWRAMGGVSSQGKKRGRARNMMRQKNLNRNGNN